MRIREAQPSDTQGIKDVQLAAFGDEGPVVADLALALIADESAKPSLVLVAESEKCVVGNIIFSSGVPTFFRGERAVEARNSNPNFLKVA